MLRTLTIAAMIASPIALANVVPGTFYALQYEGRSHKDYINDTVQINWPGTTLSTQFTGQHLSINLIGNGDHFDVLVDGQLTQKLQTKYGGTTETFELLSLPEKQTVLIEIVKRTENYQSMSKVVSLEHDGYLEGNWRNDPHILFIGDSISAGYASESDKRDCTWDEIFLTSNARLAFPYQTAERLDATFTQISFSGLGLIRNWAGNQSYHNLTDYTDKASAIFGQQLDFEDKHPSLVVVEVGTNDFSTDPASHEPWGDIEHVRADWTTRMVEYVNELKQRYHADVILMPRPSYPYDYIIPATEEAIVKLNAQGVNGVHQVTFSTAMEGCGWHPTAKEHEQIATQLSDYINANDLLD